MQRQNKNMTDRIKRDELKRVQAFVQLAYDNDPRVQLHKDQVAADKVVRLFTARSFLHRAHFSVCPPFHPSTHFSQYLISL